MLGRNKTGEGMKTLAIIGLFTLVVLVVFIAYHLVVGVVKFLDRKELEGIYLHKEGTTKRKFKQEDNLPSRRNKR